jgi:hypothetical protein
MRSLVFTAGLLTVGLAATGSMAQAPGQAPLPLSQQKPQYGRPANLCQELVIYLKQPKPGGAADAQANNPALKTAVQAPTSGNQPPQPSGQGAPTSGGLSGPIPRNVAQGTPGPQGAATAAATSAAPAQAGPSSSTVTLEQAEGFASANDLAGCRAATQRLRLAGAPLPPALLALGALDPKYLEASAAPSEPK